LKFLKFVKNDITNFLKFKLIKNKFFFSLKAIFYSYYLGSLCTRISFDFADDANHTDPNFIGAWYLGEFFTAHLFLKKIFENICILIKCKVK
jgi:hypothetical protein